MIWKTLNNQKNIPIRNTPYLVAVHFGDGEIDYKNICVMIGRYNGIAWEIVDSQDRMRITNNSDCKILAFMPLPSAIQNTVRKPENYGQYLVYIKYGGRKNYRRMIGIYHADMWYLGDLQSPIRIHPDDISDIRITTLPKLSRGEYIGGI